MSAEFIRRNAEEIYQGVYYTAQTAIGEEDGGIASMFEEESHGYGSGFANAGGAKVIEKILAHVQADDLIERIMSIPSPDIEKRFETSEHMLKSLIDEIADDVATKWHDALKRAFPEVPASDIDSAYADTKSAVSAYLSYQHTYSIEASTPTPKGMTP